MGFGCHMKIEDEQAGEVLLKPFASDDLTQMMPGMQQHSTLRWLSLRDAQTSEGEQAWYERVSASVTDVIFGVFVEDRLIGSFGLHGLADSRATAGAVIFASDRRSAGIGTSVTRAGLYYAVQVLDILVIDSSVMALNERSHRLQESAGFVTTGRIVHSQFVDGQPCDLLNLVWVNPDSHAWDYFWRGADPGAEFHEARSRAQRALDWAEEHITLL
jgi:RimJ/RimL family protein N-acetyltransferase